MEQNDLKQMDSYIGESSPNLTVFVRNSMVGVSAEISEVNENREPHGVILCYCVKQKRVSNTVFTSIDEVDHYIKILNDMKKVFKGELPKEDVILGRTFSEI